MTVQIMTDENYQSLINDSATLIIDVWAEWCGPCKRSTPVFEELATKSSNDEVVFAKLDADNNRQAASELKVTSLPTFAIFSGGNLKKRWSGADIGRLRKEIDSELKN